MIRNRIIALLVTGLMFPAGCDSSGSHSDTPTTGDLKISADETFKPLIDSELYAFESIYKYADVEVLYKPEAEAFNDLMNDSVRLIIVSRSLNKNELIEFEQWEIVPKITRIAYDAVALIGTKDIKDSAITLPELKDLLSSGSSSRFKNIKVIFDNENSGTINFLMEKTGVSRLSSNCYALKSNNAVIDYISREKNSIGVIGVNWISDQDDTTHLSFLKAVKVFEVAAEKNSEYLKPYQAYIAQKKYPLWREVYILSREAYSGLGTGLTAFIASERGQRIILKSGLVPATMPVRLVELIENEDLYINQEK